MNPAKPKLMTCAGCGYSFNASMAVCPNCGQPKGADSTAPAPQTESVQVEPRPFAMPPVQPTSKPVVWEAAPAAPAIPTGCALCGQSKPAKQLEIQGWQDQGYTLTNRHKFMVTTIRPVCLCDACSKSLQWNRVKAGAVASVPGAALAFIFPWKQEAAVVVGIAFLMYALHLIKSGAYCWADRMLYGTMLEDKLRPWVRAAKLNGDLRIPVGILHDLLRVGLFLLISLAGLLAGVVLAVALGA